MVDRYTAEELHGDTYYTLPDGAEYVLASEYAALEAEMDELKRRLDAIKAHVGFAAEAECCCEYDSNEDRIVHCAWCVDAGNIIAIAEGRDNG